MLSRIGRFQTAHNRLLSVEDWIELDDEFNRAMQMHFHIFVSLSTLWQAIESEDIPLSNSHSNYTLFMRYLEIMLKAFTCVKNIRDWIW